MNSDSKILPFKPAKPADPFDPTRPLGVDWTHERAMFVHSTIVVALEILGWHPCLAIKAAWIAVAAITTEYKLQELPHDEEIGPKTQQP